MAVPVAALAKLAAAALSGEDTRRKLGWIVAAICSPLILTLALICSLLSGSAEHNNSAVLLCFHGGDIPGKTPAEYVAYIEDMELAVLTLVSVEMEEYEAHRLRSIFGKQAKMWELDANLLRQSVRKITYGSKTVKVLLKNNQVLEECDDA